MKLADFYAAIGPFLEGRVTREEAARALYGETDSTDARRIAIYGRFCQNHRFEALDLLYAWTRRAAGDGWAALVEEYFRAHRMHHVEINENGDRFPGFLVERAPRWVAELADLEWWFWRTDVAPDAPEDRAPGPLRLASTVEIRPYHFDLLGWAREERIGAPAPRDALVVFWRDRDGDPRMEYATAEELVVLKAVHEGRAVPTGETRDDLAAAGILLGA